MREKLAKLINIKSIITILLTAVFCFLSVTEKISTQDFMTIFTVVIAFYFGTQTAKKESEVK